MRVPRQKKAFSNNCALFFNGELSFAIKDLNKSIQDEHHAARGFPFFIKTVSA